MHTVILHIGTIMMQSLLSSAYTPTPTKTIGPVPPYFTALISPSMDLSDAEVFNFFQVITQLLQHMKVLLIQQMGVIGRGK